METQNENRNQQNNQQNNQQVDHKNNPQNPQHESQDEQNDNDLDVPGEDDKVEPPKMNDGENDNGAEGLENEKKAGFNQQPQERTENNDRTEAQKK